MDNYRNYENSYADDLAQTNARNPAQVNPGSYDNSYSNYGGTSSGSGQQYQQGGNSSYHDANMDYKNNNWNSQQYNSSYYNNNQQSYGEYHHGQDTGASNQAAQSSGSSTNASVKYVYDGVGYSAVSTTSKQHKSQTYAQAPQLYKKEQPSKSPANEKKKFIGPKMPKPQSNKQQDSKPQVPRKVTKFYREGKALESNPTNANKSHSQSQVSPNPPQTYQYAHNQLRPQNPYSEISKKLVNASPIKPGVPEPVADNRDRPMQPMPSFAPRHPTPAESSKSDTVKTNKLALHQQIQQNTISSQQQMPDRITHPPKGYYGTNVAAQTQSNNMPDRIAKADPSNKTTYPPLNHPINKPVRTPPLNQSNRKPSPHGKSVKSNRIPSRVKSQYHKPMVPQNLSNRMTTPPQHQSNIIPISPQDQPNRMSVPQQSNPNRMPTPTQNQPGISVAQLHASNRSHQPWQNQPNRMQHIPEQDHSRMSPNMGQRYPMDTQTRHPFNHQITATGPVRHTSPHEPPREKVYSEFELRHVKLVDLEKLISEVNDLEKIKNVSAIVKELNMILPVGRDAKICMKDKETMYHALDEIREYFENHLRIGLRKEISKYGFQAISSHFVADAPHTMCELDEDELDNFTSEYSRQYRPANVNPYNNDSDSDSENYEHLVDGKYYTVWLDRKDCHNICMQRLSESKNTKIPLEFNGFKKKHGCITTNLDTAFVIRPEQQGLLYKLVNRGVPSKVPARVPGDRSDVVVMKVRLKKPQSNVPGLPDHLCYLDFFEWNVYAQAGKSKTVIALLEEKHPFQPMSNIKPRKRHKH